MFHFYRLQSVLLSVFMMGTAFPSLTWAVETVQLTQSEAVSHAVRDASLSPDGSRVIFTAKLDDPDIEHLYSVPVGGGPATRLTEATQAAQEIDGPTVTGDSQRVVFRGNLDDPSVFQLYTVPIIGGAVTTINGELMPGGEVESDWQMSPNGQRVVFRAEQATAGASDLYSAPINGSSPTQLTSLSALGQVTRFVIAPDSSRVAVISDQDQVGVFELGSVDIDGGQVTVLSDPLVAEGDVVDMWFSPDSSALVYLADQAVDEQFEIYHVEATGGPRTRLNEALAADRDVINAVFTPTGSRVVFLADLVTDGVFELFSVPTVGGPNLKISGEMVAGGDVFDDWQIDPVSQRVIYRADQETDLVNELFSVTVTGSLLSKLNGPLQEDGDVQSGVEVLEDRVIFIADDQQDEVRELFSVALNGDGLVRLNEPIPMPLGAFGVFGVSSQFQALDGQLYFVAPQESVVAQLYRVPIEGGPLTRVNGDGQIGRFFFSPDGGDVFYIGDDTRAGRFDLFQRSLTGLGQTVRLNPVPSSEIRGEVVDLQVSEATDRLLYLASHRTSQRELFSRPLSGGPAVPLNTLPAAGGEVNVFRISPDGNRVAFVADLERAETWQVYTNRVEGGELTRLSVPPSEGGALAFPLADQPFTPDGSRVVYAAFQEPDPQCGDAFLDFQLYSVSTSGGAPVLLNEPLDPCQFVVNFEIGSTGERVLYWVNEFGGPSRLLSVPVQGGPSTLLSGALSPGTPELSPDASRVVFQARSLEANHRTLYSVPMEGGEIVALSEVDGSGLGVFTFRISQDGTRVVFMSDQETDDTFELFSVPIAGGQVVKLSGDLVAGGEVAGFRLSQGLGRVVFSADKNTDDLREIFSVSVQGGEITRLNQELDLAGGFEVARFTLSADASLVGFTLREIDFGGAREMYVVPLAGGTPQQVSLPLGPNDSLESFELSQDGAYVLYEVEDTASEVTSYLRTATSGGLVQRFGPPNFEIARFVQNSRWFSPDGSRLLLAGEQEGVTSEEIWLSFELDLFRDGFESGSTSAWSNQMP